MRAVRVACLLFAALTLAARTAAAQSDRVVILVRHAEQTDESQRDPPLSARGSERAQALAQVLAGTEVRSVIVTNLQRTRLTAAPVAELRGITPVVVNVVGGLAQHVSAVAHAVRAQPAGGTILVVGHSNTIPAIVHALGGPALPDLCRGEFSHLYVVQLAADGTGRLVADAHYGPPDEPGAGECHR